MHMHMHMVAKVERNDPYYSYRQADTPMWYLVITIMVKPKLTIPASACTLAQPSPPPREFYMYISTSNTYHVQNCPR